MSKRFEWHSYYKRMVLDTKTNKIIKVIDTLNQQDQRIAELEEQLEEKEMLLQYGKTEIKKLNKRITDIVKRDEERR